MKDYALVIDRSTETQSLALADATGGSWSLVAEQALENVGCRSGEWTEHVERFLRSNLPSDGRLAHLVVGTGPGSFAGIRAALAFAQGYAIGSGCDVLGLPSPCAFADDKPLAVIGDARRGQRWVAIFDGRHLVTKVFQVTEEMLGKRVPRGVRITSPDGARLGESLKELFGDHYDGGGAPTAAGLVRYLAADPSVLAREPLPLYLNPAVREEKKETDEA